MNDRPINLDQAVRVMQIIAAALVMGVLVFAGIVLALGSLNQPPRGNLVSLIGAGLAILCFVLHLLVPGAAARSRAAGVSENADVSVWCEIYQTKLIMGLAMLEGAALANLVFCIVEHNWWSMAIAGVLVFWMLVQFPTRTRIEQWIETQRTNQSQQ